MGLASIFIPKQRIFYTLFEEVAVNLVRMSADFKKALREQDFQLREVQLKALDDYEHKNDDITHKLFVELGRNFITPFDREDIHALATALDDVTDYIWGSAKRIINYKIEHMDQVALDFADLIERSTIALQTAVNSLRNMRDLRAITDACVLINSIENEADDLLDTCTIRLFEREQNAVELIKRKDLYEELEIVTDKCEDAANVIESIIIKYA